MQNCLRQFQPFGGHLALNDAIFLIGDRRDHFQTMGSVPSIFLVLGLRRNSHGSFLSAIRAVANLRRSLGDVCSKSHHSQIKKGPAEEEKDQYRSGTATPNFKTGQ
jgi:hypothetical protein